MRRVVGQDDWSAIRDRTYTQESQGINEAYLYGSFARDQQDSASDIDVLVIGAPREETLAEAVRGLEKQLGPKSITPSSRPKSSHRAALARMRFYKASGATLALLSLSVIKN